MLEPYFVMVDAIAVVLCLRLVPLTMQGSYPLTTDNKDLHPQMYY